MMPRDSMNWPRFTIRRQKDVSKQEIRLLPLTTRIWLLDIVTKPISMERKRVECWQDFTRFRIRTLLASKLGAPWL